jgi:hypothetical protein
VGEPDRPWCSLELGPHGRQPRWGHPHDGPSQANVRTALLPWEQERLALSGTVETKNRTAMLPQCRNCYRVFSPRPRRWGTTNRDLETAVEDLAQPMGQLPIPVIPMILSTFYSDADIPSPFPKSSPVE